jgi:hypothetical protein
VTFARKVERTSPLFTSIRLLPVYLVLVIAVSSQRIHPCTYTFRIRITLDLEPHRAIGLRLYIKHHFQAPMSDPVCSDCVCNRRSEELILPLTVFTRIAN